MKNKMSLYECEAEAKDLGFDNATFYFCGPNGRKKCCWLDAYFGLFEIEGSSGFVATKQIAKMFPDSWCEDLKAGEVS